MLDQQQMRFGAQIMAAIFGGPGIFYVWQSFTTPLEGVTAVIYLGIATTLLLYAQGKSVSPVRAVARCKAILRGKRRP